MPDTFTLTNEVDPIIDNLIESDPDHANLRLSGATVAVLFRHGDGPMQHGGKTALAFIKKTAARDRVMGLRDLIITIDREPFEDLTEAGKLALVDHELYHAMPVVLETRIEGEGADAKEVPVFDYDTAGRPKIAMRRHDIEVGWFIRMVQKHGDASMEKQQAREIADQYGNLLFDFEAPRTRGNRRMEKAVEGLAKAAGPGMSVTITSEGKSTTIAGK